MDIKMLTSLVASTKAVASKAATYNGPPNKTTNYSHIYSLVNTILADSINLDKQSELHSLTLACNILVLR